MVMNDLSKPCMLGDVELNGRLMVVVFILVAVFFADLL
jgi:hypothetical protein